MTKEQAKKRIDEFHAFAGSGMRQRGGILQVWPPAGGFVCFAAGSLLKTGQRQV